MTMLVIDGFDYTASSTFRVAQGWVGDVPGTVASSAFSYGNSIRPTYDATLATAYRYIRKRVVATETAVIGARINVPNEPASISSYFVYLGVYDSTTSTRQFYLYFDVFGVVYVRNNAGTTLAQSAPNCFIPGTWFYLELKFKVADAGTMEIRINTVTVLSAPSIDLNSSTSLTPGWTHFRIDSKSTLGYSPLFLIDDFYVLDSNGSVNNDFLGNVRVKALMPASNYSVVFSIGGTAPAPTNWQSVLNTSLDDTKYVYSPNIGDQDLYNITAILNTPLVHALEIDGSYRQDDATQRFAKNTLQTATGVGAEGTSHALNQTYSIYADMFELNPDTGVGWTGAEVNTLRIGPKVDA